MTGWNFIWEQRTVRHYFGEDQLSLCGKAMIYADRPGMDVPNDDRLNCRACQNRLRKMMPVEDDDDDDIKSVMENSNAFPGDLPMPSGDF